LSFAETTHLLRYPHAPKNLLLPLPIHKINSGQLSDHATCSRVYCQPRDDHSSLRIILRFDTIAVNHQIMSKRTHSDSKVHHNLDDNDDDVDNKRAKSTQPSSINHYTGWKVPSDNYIIPTIRIGDSNADDDDGNEITPESFYSEYIRQRKPVVLRVHQNDEGSNNNNNNGSGRSGSRSKFPSIIDDLSKLNKWKDVQYLKSQIDSKVKVMVEQRSSGTSTLCSDNTSSNNNNDAATTTTSKTTEELATKAEETTTTTFGNGNEISITFHNFLNILQSGSTNHYLTTQDVQCNADGRPELMSEFMKCLKHDITLQPMIMGGLILQNVNLWMGNTAPAAADCGDGGSGSGSGGSSDDNAATAAASDSTKGDATYHDNNNNKGKGTSNNHMAKGISSGLHHDYHDNLYIVLKGTKRFRLYSPHDTERMYTRGKLLKVHPNGRINYVGEETTAYGSDIKSDLAAKASRRKERAEQLLMEAERAVEMGKVGAEQLLEEAELELENAMDDILDAEMDDDDDDDDDADNDCNGDGKGGGVIIESFGNEKQQRLVDKTVKDPNNFSHIKPHMLDDTTLLNERYPNFLDATSAYCTVEEGDILYLPASWFHEVTSYSSDSNVEGKTTEDGHHHLAGKCRSCLMLLDFCRYRGHISTSLLIFFYLYTQ
jgi:hypothetical protein